MRKRFQLAGLSVASAAAAILLLVLMWAPGTGTDHRVMAAEVLAQAASGATGVKTVHLKCRMRTLPADNFSMLGAQYEFVDLEVWKQLASPAKYRIEKPGRVLVCDGESTIMLIKPDTAVKGPAGANFDAAWLRDLADVNTLVGDELQKALANGWEISVKNEGSKQVVTVDAKALPNTSKFMRNKFLDMADTRRVFRFGAQSKRLQEMQILLQDKGKETSVFEVTTVEYDQPLPESIFTLELPKNVNWLDLDAKQPLPDNAKYASMKPEEVTRDFFEACGKADWDEAEKFWPGKLNDRAREHLAGIKIVSLGQPFQASPYPGWFIPYEIQTNDGQNRKHNLAIRNDNPAKRWVVDGGI